MFVINYVARECNKRVNNRRKSRRNEFECIVFDVFQELYVSVFYTIYLVWKNGNKTMADSGFVIKDIEDSAKRKPLEFMTNFKQVSTTTSARKNSEGDEKLESFVGIEDL